VENPIHSINNTTICTTITSTQERITTINNSEEKQQINELRYNIPISLMIDNRSWWQKIDIFRSSTLMVNITDSEKTCNPERIYSCMLEDPFNYKVLRAGVCSLGNLLRDKKESSPDLQWLYFTSGILKFVIDKCWHLFTREDVEKSLLEEFYCNSLYLFSMCPICIPLMDESVLDLAVKLMNMFPDSRSVNWNASYLIFVLLENHLPNASIKLVSLDGISLLIATMNKYIAFTNILQNCVISLKLLFSDTAIPIFLPAGGLNTVMTAMKTNPTYFPLQYQAGIVLKKALLKANDETLLEFLQLGGIHLFLNSLLIHKNQHDLHSNIVFILLHLCKHSPEFTNEVRKANALYIAVSMMEINPFGYHLNLLHYLLSQSHTDRNQFVQSGALFYLMTKCFNGDDEDIQWFPRHGKIVLQILKLLYTNTIVDQCFDSTKTQLILEHKPKPNVSYDVMIPLYVVWLKMKLKTLLLLPSFISDENTTPEDASKCLDYLESLLYNEAVSIYFKSAVFALMEEIHFRHEDLERCSNIIVNILGMSLCEPIIRKKAFETMCIVTPRSTIVDICQTNIHLKRLSNSIDAFVLLSLCFEKYSKKPDIVLNLLEVLTIWIRNSKLPLPEAELPDLFSLIDIHISNEEIVLLATSLLIELDQLLVEKERYDTPCQYPPEHRPTFLKLLELYPHSSRLNQHCHYLLECIPLLRIPKKLKEIDPVYLI
jgi:hypothetical protein